MNNDKIFSNQKYAIDFSLHTSYLFVRLGKNDDEKMHTLRSNTWHLPTYTKVSKYEQLMVRLW